MSDHHTEPGGHEIDRMPHVRLFVLLIGLSGLTVLASYGVIQMVYMQTKAIAEERAVGGAFSRNEYEAEMKATVEGEGRFKMTDSKDGPTARYYIPVKTAREKLEKNPNLLKATRAYPEWEATAPGALVTKLKVPSKAKPPAKRVPGARPPGRRLAPKPNRGIKPQVPRPRPTPKAPTPR